MGGFATRRVKYAIGIGADRTVKDLDEGLPVVQGALLDIASVTDGITAPLVSKATPGILDSSFDIGSIYYTVTPSLVWSPSSAVRILDALFESTVAGAGPTYTRAYVPSAVPAIPADFVSFWKWVAKAANTVSQCAYGGIVKGFTLSADDHGPLIFTPELVFAFKDDSVAGMAADAGWDLPATGDLAPWLGASRAMLYRTGSGAYLTAALRSFRLTASWEIAPHFYSSINPDRIDRSELKMDGEITFRDTADEVEVWNAYCKNKTTVELLLVDTVSGCTLSVACKIHAPAEGDDGTSRLGQYNFTLVETSALAPFTLSVLPDRA